MCILRTPGTTKSYWPILFPPQIVFDNFFLLIENSETKLQAETLKNLLAPHIFPNIKNKIIKIYFNKDKCLPLTGTNVFQKENFKCIKNMQNFIAITL